MQRRSFLNAFVPAAGMAAFAQDAPRPIESYDDHGPLVIERLRGGKPRAGQVVVALQPHSDDIPIFAAGTLFMLMDEGATAYLIRATNDDMAGPGWYDETVTANARDHAAVAKVFGVRKTFDLNYNNHMMDNIARSELRARLIFLFRLLKADILLTYDPTGHYEENPDHYVTSACAEAAAWMAGGTKDYPEHFEAGLKPHSISEKYYFARFQQRVNRVVDVTPFVERKIDVNLENKAQGPSGETGARLRASLQKQGKQLPLLGPDDNAANRNYIREFVLARDREIGAKYGLPYAEQFHYIGPPPDTVKQYIQRNATPR